MNSGGRHRVRRESGKPKTSSDSQDQYRVNVGFTGCHVHSTTSFYSGGIRDSPIHCPRKIEDESIDSNSKETVALIELEVDNHKLGT